MIEAGSGASTASPGRDGHVLIATRVATRSSRSTQRALCFGNDRATSSARLPDGGTRARHDPQEVLRRPADTSSAAYAARWISATCCCASCTSARQALPPARPSTGRPEPISARTPLSDPGAPRPRPAGPSRAAPAPASGSESAERSGRPSTGFDEVRRGAWPVGGGATATPCWGPLAVTLARPPGGPPSATIEAGDPVGMLESIALGIDLFDLRALRPGSPGGTDPVRRGPIQPEAGRRTSTSDEPLSTPPAACRCAPAGPGPTSRAPRW